MVQPEYHMCVRTTKPKGIDPKNSLIKWHFVGYNFHATINQGWDVCVRLSKM